MISECLDKLEALLSDFRDVGRAHGYAIALHGSRERDLDLAAVPWVEEVSDPDALVDALEADLDLVAIRRDGKKPHGRVGYILCGRRWREGDDHQPIDLSVVSAR